MGMSRIFWDTNLFIYLFEDYGRLSALTARLLTSTLTVGEVLVKPKKTGEDAVCDTYERAIASSALLIPFDLKAARKYASLRLDRGIKPPDAIQLACAGAAGTDLFVTNDGRLQGKKIDG